MGGKSKKCGSDQGSNPGPPFSLQKGQNTVDRDRTVPEPYSSFILTVLYGFEPYRTVTVPDIRSENGDTAYKHSPV